MNIIHFEGLESLILDIYALPQVRTVAKLPKNLTLEIKTHFFV